jgi:hypothetical protein
MYGNSGLLPSGLLSLANSPMTDTVIDGGIGQLS